VKIARAKRIRKINAPIRNGFFVGTLSDYVDLAIMAHEAIRLVFRREKDSYSLGLLCGFGVMALEP
jgi:hypothetical protein